MFNQNWACVSDCVECLKWPKDAKHSLLPEVRLAIVIDMVNMLQRLTSPLCKKKKKKEPSYLNPFCQRWNLNRCYLDVMEPNGELHYLSKPQGAPADGAPSAQAVSVLHVANVNADACVQPTCRYAWRCELLRHSFCRIADESSYCVIVLALETGPSSFRGAREVCSGQYSLRGPGTVCVVQGNLLFLHLFTERLRTMSVCILPCPVTSVRLLWMRA